MIIVKLRLVLAKINSLDLKSIDSVLTFPQAELDVDIWMELRTGFEPQNDPYRASRYVLKLNKNIIV